VSRAPLGLLAIILLLTVPPAFASSAVRECDPTTPSYTVAFLLYGYSGTANYGVLPRINLGSCGGYFTSATMTNELVNFTSISLLSSSNPSQSFGVGVKHINQTLISVTSEQVGFTTTFTTTTFTAQFPKMFYYFPRSTGAPSNVTIIAGSPATTTVIPSSTYVSTTGLFAACTSLCAFVNTLNDTLIVKEPSSSPLLTYFCVSVCAATPTLSGTVNIDLWVFALFSLVIFVFGMIALIGKAEWWPLFAMFGFLIGMLFVASLSNYGKIIMSYASTGLPGTTTSIWPLAYIPLFFTVLDLAIALYRVSDRLRW
jgi:hypothetical protein